VVSGERYKQIPDEVIKYVMGYYGEPAAPIDQNIVDRVMSLPRAKQFVNWRPEGYDKSIEEFRREIGPELSDDELLLKILIPGKPVRSSEPKKMATPPAMKTMTSVTPMTNYPTEFTVDVDGEVFNVRISPVWDGAGKTERALEAGKLETVKRPKEVPSGAVLCGMAGLILSIEARAGASVNAGDLLAVIEAMKMRRHVNSPHSGVVKEIRVLEGEMVAPDDILMVVEE
jgi:biotin carboxyl carrier protein